MVRKARFAQDLLIQQCPRRQATFWTPAAVPGLGLAPGVPSAGVPIRGIVRAAAPATRFPLPEQGHPQGRGLCGGGLPFKCPWVCVARLPGQVDGRYAIEPCLGFAPKAARGSTPAPGISPVR